MLREKEDTKKELYDSQTTLEDVKKKYNTIKNEHITQAGELERLRTEFFVANQTLSSKDREHSEELKSYQDEIEDLNGKILDLEKKLDDAKAAAADNLSVASNDLKLDEDPFSPEEMTLKLADGFITEGSGSQSHRRNSASRGSIMNRDKRISFNQGGAQSEFKNKLASDAQHKDLLDKIAELQQQVDDSKLAHQKLKTELDQISHKLKEESRAHELCKKKNATKDSELEQYRTRLLQDGEKFTMALNELHDELEVRENQMKQYKRRIRLMQTQSSVESPISASK